MACPSYNSHCFTAYVQVPGPKGEDAAGTDGVDGVNAYGITTLGFVVPAVGATVDVTLDNADWMVSGSGSTQQIVFVQNAGYYGVASVTGDVATLTNMGYPTNLGAGTAIPLGQKVAPGGLQGVSTTNNTIDTITDLIALTTHVDGTFIVVFGGAVAGDGLGGIFWYNGSSAAVANNATIVQPADVVGNGRWLKLL